MTKSNHVRSIRIIILIHVLIWIALLLVPLLFIESQEGMKRYITFGGAHLVFIAGYFYINYLFFIPKFLLKKNFRAFILTVLLALIVISLINVIYDLQIHNYFFPGSHHLNSLSRSVFGAIFGAFLAFGLSTSIRITDEWIRNEKLRKEMETEKLTSELAFLKSQVNPHFLFNILNNICSLARKKSDDTENAIIKLSQIMRYMLYDSKDEKVSLEKEVDYLRNYIELQRMRISENVQISFVIEGKLEGHVIEPLLLIPFVENAFKHGVSYLEQSMIRIYLGIKEHNLDFQVKNNIVRKGTKHSSDDTGIGLKNVYRRLDLLYPEKHEISITDNDTVYHVDLKLWF